MCTRPSSPRGAAAGNDKFFGTSLDSPGPLCPLPVTVTKLKRTTAAFWKRIVNTRYRSGLTEAHRGFPFIILPPRKTPPPQIYANVSKSVRIRAEFGGTKNIIVFDSDRSTIGPLNRKHFQYISSPSRKRVLENVLTTRVPKFFSRKPF